MISYNRSATITIVLIQLFLKYLQTSSVQRVPQGSATATQVRKELQMKEYVLTKEEKERSLGLFVELEGDLNEATKQLFDDDNEKGSTFVLKGKL